MMKRFLSVYLPDWPWQRLVREHPELRERSVVLVEAEALRGARVVLANARARQRGIRAGMPVAEAKSIDRRLHVEDMNPQRDLRALERLAEWAERYSPLVEVCLSHGLLLDITGCDAYFHGEENLVRRVTQELRGEGCAARVASAGALGAAWALSRWAAVPSVTPSEQTEQALRPLPIAALRLPEEALSSLYALGIERVEQLLELPRAELPGRFGTLVLERVDQALGRAAEVLAPHRVLPEVQAHQAFEFGVHRLEVIHQVLEQLTETIAGMLTRQNRGAKKLECRLCREQGAPARFVVSLSRASRAAPYLWMLLRTHLEGVRFEQPLSREEPIVAVSLRVVQMEAVAENQADLFATENPHEEELANLIDRLSSRLGPQAVTRPQLVPDPQPEYACRFEPVIEERKGRGQETLPRRGRGRNTSLRRGGARSGDLAPAPRGDLASSQWEGELASRERQRPEDGPERPLRLWPRPERIEVLSTLPGGLPLRFSWQDAEHRVLHARGPERIATGWWRGDDIERDYYAITTQQGTRFWIFRCRREGTWFLHGCFE